MGDYERKYSVYDFVVCKACGAVVSAFRMDRHDKVCPQRLLERLEYHEADPEGHHAN